MSSAYLTDACRHLLGRGPRRAWRWLLLLSCSVAVPILAGAAAGRFADNPAAVLWFAPPIFLIALWGGLAPASVTILVSLAAFDYWVLPPQHSIILTHLSDLWMAVGLAPCAAIASFLGVRLRRQLRTIRRHETRSDALRLLSHAVVSQGSSEAICFAAANALSRACEARAVVLIGVDGTLALAGASRGAAIDGGDLRAAEWALSNNSPVGLSSAIGAGSLYDFWPLMTPTLTAVLGVERKAGETGEGPRDGVVELVAGYLLASSRPRPSLRVVR